VSLVLLAVLCAGTVHASGPRRVAIRVYDTSSSDAVARAEAIAHTTSIFARAGITTEWRDCSPDAGRCEEVRNKGELVLRIVPTHVEGYDPTAGSIATRRHANDTGLALAFAVVEPRARIGVLATVFRDRVQTVADRAGIPFDALLGRTIAHELGHLLLGTMGHGRSGLMRETWTDDELKVGEQRDWVFAQHEAKSMQAGLRRNR
jgi:hypothetical protein